MAKIQDKIDSLSEAGKQSIKDSSMLQKIVEYLKICRLRDCNKTVYKEQFCCPEHELLYKKGLSASDSIEEAENITPDNELYIALFAPLKKHYCIRDKKGAILSRNGEPIVFPAEHKVSMEKDIASMGEELAGATVVRADKAFMALVKLNKPVEGKPMLDISKAKEVKI